MRNKDMDMINGPLLGKIIIFTIPIILSGVLQFTFNATDTIIVGRFAGSDSLAAVGSTTSVVTLLINVFMGLSVGANVVTSQLYGQGNVKGLKESVYTSIATSIISGVILVFLGFFFTRPILVLMGSPADVIDKSVLYLRIYFFCMPASMIFNFCSAVLRTFGDTKRPLNYLIISGIIHVILNIVFVVVFKWDVAGVAFSSVLSQSLSAVLIMRVFFKDDAVYKITLKDIKIYKKWFLKIIKIGVPTGLTNTVYSFSNIVTQSAVNALGSTVMAGNSAAASIEYIPYIAANSFHNSAITFTSQNYGAKKYERILKVTVITSILNFFVALCTGGSCALFGRSLASLYSSDPEIIGYAALRMKIVGPFYSVGSLNETLTGVLRGMGYSTLSMLIVFIFVCGIRMLYIMTMYKQFETFGMLYAIFPVSWAISAMVLLIAFIYLYKKLIKENKSEI